jgi:NitT/TauT family transport system substrate-binding protein
MAASAAQATSQEERVSTDAIAGPPSGQGGARRARIRPVHGHSSRCAGLYCRRDGHGAQNGGGAASGAESGRKDRLLPLAVRLSFFAPAAKKRPWESAMHRRTVLLSSLAALAAPRIARAAADRVAFGLDWKAEAEYGGYYQAAATGIYAKHGLDVTIRQGGPSVNHAALLLAGRLDFNITSNSFLALNFVKQDIPFRTVAAMFQKDPSVLIAHHGQGNDSFAALKGKPIMISADTRIGWWNFLKAKYGYSDSQIRPYDFNLQPFLANKKAVQQGFLGSEPFSIKQATGKMPVVLLVADAGFTGYASLIGTSDKYINTRPDLVKRFVDASIEGWYSYLYGDPSPGNARIRQANPEMTEALIAYGRQSLIQHGILTSGDAAKLGIGAMTQARWQDFYQSVQSEGLYPKGMDVAKAYTLKFVDRKVGMGMAH